MVHEELENPPEYTRKYTRREAMRKFFLPGAAIGATAALMTPFGVKYALDQLLDDELQIPPVTVSESAGFRISQVDGYDTSTIHLLENCSDSKVDADIQALEGILREFRKPASRSNPTQDSASDDALDAIAQNLVVIETNIGQPISSTAQGLKISERYVLTVAHAISTSVIFQYSRTNQNREDPYDIAFPEVVHIPSDRLYVTAPEFQNIVVTDSDDSSILVDTAVIDPITDTALLHLKRSASKPKVVRFRRQDSIEVGEYSVGVAFNTGIELDLSVDNPLSIRHGTIIDPHYQELKRSNLHSLISSVKPYAGASGSVIADAEGRVTAFVSGPFLEPGLENKLENYTGSINSPADYGMQLITSELQRLRECRK